MFEGLQYDRPSNVFSDVRFVLLGFDPINKPMVLSKLVDGGGVDVGQYGPICTHVIVDKLLYDDPICVAARSDGKTLVNGLWVAHSFDVGMPVDPNSIMYRPLRDLKGISGAKSLVVCLTGYQCQDREDIMTMVSLMGANFSKPLVANKVTHLICYKFEGEKYELAKKMKKIKLVNHLWLEDCLKAWEILPEADYDKSGYELEVLEAEAKDSEEETDIASKHYELLNPNQELRRNQLHSSASKGLSNVIDTNDMVSTTGYERISDQDPCHPEVLDSRDGEPVKTYERTAVPVTVGIDLASTSRNERSPHPDARKLSPKSYSRKTMHLGGMAGNLGTTPTVSTGNYNVSYGFDISMTKKLKDGTDINCFRTPKGTVLRPEEQSTILDEKRKMNVSCGNSKSQKSGHNSEAHISAGSVEMTRSELVEPASLISGPVETNNRLFSNNDAHYSSLAAALNTPQRSSATISSIVGRKSLTSGTPFSKTVNSEIRHDGKLEEALQINSAGSNKDSLGCKSVGKDVATGEAPKLSSPRSKRLQIEKSSDTPNQSLHADAYLKPPTRKMFGRKSWSNGNTTNLKGSIYLDKSVSEDDPAINSIAGHEKLVMVPPTVNLTVLVAPTYGVSQSRNKIQQHSMSTDDETEAPEDNEQNVIREAVSEEKYGEDEPHILGEDDKSEDLQTNETDGNALGVHSHNTTVGKDKDGTKQQKDTCGEAKLGESTHMQKVAKENISGGKKRPPSKINKTTVPSKVPETKAVPEVVSEENYSVVEEETIGVENALGVHSHKKASAEEKDGSKQKKSTCGKRKLGESPHMEKVVKENMSRGGKHPPSKINKTTIPSEVLVGKEENEVPGALCEEKYGEVEPDIVGNVGAEDKSEEVQTYKTDCNALGVLTHKTSVADKDGTKQKKTTCGKRKLGQSTRMEDVVKEKKNAGAKRPLNKFSKGTGLSVTKIAAIEEAESEKNEGSAPHPAGKTKRTRSLNNLTQSVEVEKENMAICAVDQNVSHGKKRVGKLASKASRKIDTEASKSNLDKVQVSPKPEPVWFILSGHKLQRKEFQQVIRRLKGKVCNVSHQWSYQATHFIVPDPVRRIEKFFAAAASGRWILKTSYLSDSNREGKFLAEEPYEWYKSGLSEDGAINLEAPRKWRFQRERTGHGAFYKMSIIIYGECISPSLDTLKRVVKAGDGMILATSPPYTRFLDSGVVDFAVVSPGMPHVDMWVQEFLRHEIPCVVADYLVEFICKPGYSLERHVQYNTHVWAEKAFKKLVKQSEEDVGLMTPPNDDDDSGSDLPPCHQLVTSPNDCSDSDDLPCQVCGSYDRGEEMLICGDESGSIGCGIGMHIDCCDPPLADVPEEDWFCPKCSENRRSKKPPKSTK